MSIVFYPAFLSQDFSLNPELTSLARLAAQQAPKDPPVSASPILGGQTHAATPNFLMWMLEI